MSSRKSKRCDKKCDSDCDTGCGKPVMVFKPKTYCCSALAETCCNGVDLFATGATGPVALPVTVSGYYKIVEADPDMTCCIEKVCDGFLIVKGVIRKQAVRNAVSDPTPIIRPMNLPSQVVEIDFRCLVESKDICTSRVYKVCECKIDCPISECFGVNGLNLTLKSADLVKVVVEQVCPHPGRAVIPSVTDVAWPTEAITEAEAGDTVTFPGKNLYLSTVLINGICADILACSDCSITVRLPIDGDLIARIEFVLADGTVVVRNRAVPFTA